MMTCVRINQLLCLDAMTVCRPELFFLKKQQCKWQINSTEIVVLLLHVNESNINKKKMRIKFTYLGILNLLYQLD